MSPRDGRNAARSAVAGAVVLVLVGAGCGEIETPKASEYQPASLSAAEDGLKTVTLTREATERIELGTAPVVVRGAQRAVPYEAVIYDGQGLTWVYTVVKPFSYKRARITVVAVEHDQAVLSNGPPVKTLVVTQGCTQVYGAELGMAGKH
jgi:hypothetical protein